MTQDNGNQSIAIVERNSFGAESIFANTNSPKIAPATSGGSNAWVMRRVGGDQKHSASFNACRRTRKNEPTIASAATTAQYIMNARGVSIFAIHPANAPADPRTPLYIMMGASA